MFQEFTAELICTQAWFTHTRCINGMEQDRSKDIEQESNDMADIHYRPWKKDMIGAGDSHCFSAIGL